MTRASRVARPLLSVFSLTRACCPGEWNNATHPCLRQLPWLPTAPPERRPLAESGQVVREFIAAHENWVIEGCYTDLLELTESVDRLVC